MPTFLDSPREAKWSVTHDLDSPRAALFYFAVQDSPRMARFEAIFNADSPRMAKWLVVPADFKDAFPEPYALPKLALFPSVSNPQNDVAGAGGAMGAYPVDGILPPLIAPYHINGFAKYDTE
jgi:hypothetical protein